MNFSRAKRRRPGDGRVVGLGATIVANGYRVSYQNPQWFTNLLDRQGMASTTTPPG